MDFASSRKFRLNRTLNRNRPSLNSRTRLYMQLASLIMQERLSESTESTDIAHELDDIIAFRSQKEADEFESFDILRDNIPLDRLELPSAPDIPDDEFQRIQRSLGLKSPNKTIQEYLELTKRGRSVPDEVHELLAVDLYDDDDENDDEWSDLEPECDPDLEQTLKKLGVSSALIPDPGGVGLAVDTQLSRRGEISDVETSMCCDDSSSTASSSCHSETEYDNDHKAGSTHLEDIDNDAVEGPVSEHTDLSAPSHGGLDLQTCRNDCIVQLERLEDNHLYAKDDPDDTASNVSGFHPKSCSTSIGHLSSVDTGDVEDRLRDFLSEADKGVVADLEATMRAAAPQSREHLAKMGTKTSLERDLPSSAQQIRQSIAGTGSPRTPPTTSSQGSPSTAWQRGRLVPIMTPRRYRNKLDQHTRTGSLPANPTRRRLVAYDESSIRNNSNNSDSTAASLLKRLNDVDIGYVTPPKQSRVTSSDSEKRTAHDNFTTPSASCRRTLEQALAPTIDLSSIIQISSSPSGYRRLFSRRSSQDMDDVIKYKYFV